MDSVISIRNISKSFGSQVVLDNVSFDINEGEVVGIVGPSGVGKSVLLKLIMGIFKPNNGEIFINGKSITKANTEDKKQKIREDMGILFQSAALLDSLPIFENIRFPLDKRKDLTQAEKFDAVVDIAKALSLTGSLHMYPQQVSLGVRKRAGMARALITEPKIFLLDEPNTGLDPLVGQEVYDLINVCRKKWGFTGLVISHELPEVFQVCDKLIMLLNGGIIARGTPDDFINSKNLAVQQFLNGKTDGPIRIQ